MKNTARLFGALFITISYCLAIGLASYAPPSVLQSNAAAEKESHFIAISTNLLSPTSQPKNTTSNLSNALASALEKPFSGQWAAARAIERIIESKFVHYSHISINLLIHHRKSDLIFPFHYFW